MDRCNFRCPYCMPRETFHEHYRFLHTARAAVVRGDRARSRACSCRWACASCASPAASRCCASNLADLVGDLSAIEGVDDIALTTNGVLLAQHAAELEGAGLSRVTVSLDRLDHGRVRAHERRLRRARARCSTASRPRARRASTPIKINAVDPARRQRRTRCSTCVEHFRGTGVIVRFIEYMDVGNRNDWRPSSWSCRRAELRRRIHARWPLRPRAPATTAARSPSAMRFEDGAGEVGFISSVTQPFCGACSRARLSSDGVFYTCLFATDGHGPARAAARRRGRRGARRA